MNAEMIPNLYVKKEKTLVQVQETRIRRTHVEDGREQNILHHESS